MLKSYGKECFHFMPYFLRTTFRKSIAKNELGEMLVDGLVERLVDGLVESQKKIVELIVENPRITKKSLAEKTGISSTAVDKNLKTLKIKGIINRVGSDRGGHWEVIFERKDNSPYQSF